MRRILFLCSVLISTLGVVSCKTPLSSGLADAVIDHSEIKLFFARVVGYAPNAAPRDRMVGALTGIKTIQVESIDGSTSFQIRVDSNSIVDDDHPEREDKNLLETAMKNKSIFAFKTAAYNGKDNPPSLLRLETRVTAAIITDMIDDQVPLPTDAPCTDTTPLCGVTQLDVTPVDASVGPFKVDINSNTDVSQLPKDFSTKEAVSKKTPLLIAISRDMVGRTGNPLALLVRVAPHQP